MRKTLAVGITAAITAGLAAFVPVAANATCAVGNTQCADTTLTVNLTGGGLSLLAPSTATLSGSSAPGTVIGPTNMGSSATSVTDNRGTLQGWTVSAVPLSNLASIAHPAHTISLAAPSPLLVAVPSVLASGTASLTGVGIGAGGALTTGTPVTVATAQSLGGAGTYTFTPTLTLTVPPNTFAESDYTTTIEQTVV